MHIIFSILILILSSYIIFLAGKRFASASSNLGDYLGLPKSVKGATFDAVSSSLPELLVAVYSIIFFKQFELGLGTIVGSSLFNLLVILAICVLASSAIFKVSEKVVSREAIFYLISIFVLSMVVFYFKSWTIGIALVFLLFYVWYVSNLVKHTKEHKKTIEKRIKISMKKEVITFVLTLVAIGVATYLLTSSAIDISVFLNINPIVIGFTVVAMATSLPDTIISYVNAKKGDFDDAISNIFGSNIFNIFIGLSIPVILAVIFGLKANIDFANIEIIFALLGISILVIYLLLQNYSINKSQAYLFLLIYLLFNAYVIYLSFV